MLGSNLNFNTMLGSNFNLNTMLGPSLNLNTMSGSGSYHSDFFPRRVTTAIFVIMVLLLRAVVARGWPGGETTVILRRAET